MLEALFSSRVRAKIISTMFLSPGTGHSAWDISQSQQERYSAVWRELNRLERVGILVSEQRGRSKIFSVDTTCPIAPELRAIVLKTEGVGKAIRIMLAEVDGVQEAYIFGSFASGTADSDSDLDLMIIGDVKLESVARLVFQAEKELNRPVNYLLFTEAEWHKKIWSKDPFAMNVIDSPRIILVGANNAA
jgi:predicted nucleotidyltransferase